MQKIIEKNNFKLYDFVPIGICIINRDYTILFWNKCIEGWSGISRTEILGKNLLELYPRLYEPAYKKRIDL